MGGLFGGKAKKAAKIQAAATLEAANNQAAADRLAAQAAQAGRETLIAQTRAAEAAKEMLDKPMDQVEVEVANVDEAEIDPVSKRRRPTRAAFMTQTGGGSGIKI